MWGFFRKKKSLQVGEGRAGPGSRTGASALLRRPGRARGAAQTSELGSPDAVLTKVTRTESCQHRPNEGLLSGKGSGLRSGAWQNLRGHPGRLPLTKNTNQLDWEVKRPRKLPKPLGGSCLGTRPPLTATGPRAQGHPPHTNLRPQLPSHEHSTTQ